MMQQDQSQIEEINQIKYPYSIKLETSAKGIRPHIHVYAIEENDAIATSIRTYERIVASLKEHNIPVAPMNGPTD